MASRVAVRVGGRIDMKIMKIMGIRTGRLTTNATWLLSWRASGIRTFLGPAIIALQLPHGEKKKKFPTVSLTSAT